MPFRPTARGLRLTVRVQPRSSRSRVAGMYGEALKVQVTAPPVEGAANEAVVEVVAAWLGVSRGCLSIVHGHHGREKVVEIESDRPEALRARVREAVQTLVDKKKGRA